MTWKLFALCGLVSVAYCVTRREPADMNSDHGASVSAVGDHGAEERVTMQSRRIADAAAREAHSTPKPSPSRMVGSIEQPVQSERGAIEVAPLPDEAPAAGSILPSPPKSAKTSAEQAVSRLAAAYREARGGESPVEAPSEVGELLCSLELTSDHSAAVTVDSLLRDAKQCFEWIEEPARQYREVADLLDAVNTALLTGRQESKTSAAVAVWILEQALARQSEAVTTIDGLRSRIDNESKKVTDQIIKARESARQAGWEGGIENSVDLRMKEEVGSLSIGRGFAERLELELLPLVEVEARLEGLGSRLVERRLRFELLLESVRMEQGLDGQLGQRSLVLPDAVTMLRALARD